MRSPWSSRPWPARPTSWSTGRGRSSRCTTPGNTTSWSPSGEQVTAGLTGAGAAGARRQRALLARLADPDPHRRRPWQGAHRGDRDGRARAAHGRRARCRWSPASRASGRDNRITTLGRGGSDTSAVALAAALKADRCDIFTDVDGVYTTDPRIVAKARKLDKITYEEMLEMASLGAKVLQTRSVEMAMKHRVRAAGAVELRRQRPARWSSMRTRSWNRNWSAASPTAATRPRSP